MDHKYKPAILVCYEKHVTCFYWALTQEQLFKNCLDILTQRFEEGWYYHPDPDTSEPEIPLKQINELPDGSIKKAAVAAYKNWQRRKKQNKQAREDYRAIKYVVEESKDGQEAWYWLQNMSDGEYERVSLEYPYGDLSA